MPCGFRPVTEEGLLLLPMLMQSGDWLHSHPLLTFLCLSTTRSCYYTDFEIEKLSSQTQFSYFTKQARSLPANTTPTTISLKRYWYILESYFKLSLCILYDASKQSDLFVCAAACLHTATTCCYFTAMRYRKGLLKM